MNKITIVYLCVFVIISQSDASCNLPFSKRCKRNDENFQECWKSTLEEVPQYLQDGIPDLNVPPINPWKSHERYILTGTTYEISHEYMEHSGMNNFEVKDVTINLSANIILFKLRFPKLDHTCTMLANGTILNFKLMGVTGCKEAKADVSIEFVFQGKRVTKKGNEYIDFNNIETTVRGKYTNQKFHNFVAGGPSANDKFSIEAEKAEAFFGPLYDECIRTSLGLDIALAIKNVYSECPLGNLHP